MKKLIAIAIAAAISVPALADTTLYGQLHASLDLLDGAAGAAKETTVSSNSSRIGIKGSTELSGGLKAIYQAEWGMDTGGKKSGLSDRNQVVGIAGGFGAVLIGRHDTPLKIVGRKADLFWSTQLGQNRNIVIQQTNWDARVDNVIAYQSPKIGGFQALYAYVTDLAEDDGNTANSINGFYKAGPMTLGGGYEVRDLDGTDDVSALRLMGTYKFGDAKIVGYYQDEDNGAAGDADVWGIGGSYKVSSAGTLKAQYYARDEDGNNLDGSLIALGYDHKLGKKTHVYAQYAATEDLGGIGGRGHGERIASDTGGDASGLSFGLRHKF